MIFRYLFSTENFSTNNYINTNPTNSKINRKKYSFTPPEKRFNNKELYSILVNGLKFPSSSAKFDFMTSVNSSINISCELLKQKYDYRYIDKCLEKTRGVNRVDEIHKLILRSYDYISQPKHNSTIEINPYLVKELSKNIEKIIETGRNLILHNGNTCHCKYSVGGICKPC